jgi:uncharacterized repeat protein (TIGR03803 family)
MTRIRQASIGKLFAAAVAMVFFSALTTILIPAVQAQSFSVLHAFNGGAEGGGPYGGVIFDSAGNLFGNLARGGDPRDCVNDAGCGVVYELSPSSSGVWKEIPLYVFLNNTGALPGGNLLLDSAGEIFGVAEEGGGSPLCGFIEQGCGLIFQLSVEPSGGYQESPLWIFDGKANGGVPAGSLIADETGDLYGTTYQGGNIDEVYRLGCGVVFRLLPNGSGGWAETVLYSFSCGADGALPFAGLISDDAGNLYGTTYQGGKANKSCQYGCGVVFELSPSSSGTWTETVIYSFNGGSDGSNPVGGVAMDAAGNLFGTTANGGPDNYGTVFKLTPRSGAWEEILLHTFTGGSDGAYPYAGVTLDSADNVYGTAESGGNTNDCLGGGGCGVVFKFARVGGKWKETVLHAFTGRSDGEIPEAPLKLGRDGNLYGTAVFGGAFGGGTVFRVTP